VTVGPLPLACIGIDQSLHTIDQLQDVEVDQQSGRAFQEPHVSQHLGVVDGQHVID
jgi:hypothetical protein